LTATLGLFSLPRSCPAMAHLLGIDVGTTGTRAVIIEPNGSVVGATTADHPPMAMPRPGWAEQDPEDWWQATIRAVRGALERARLTGADITAVGLSGQMHGVVLLDQHDAVLRPALIWCDQRSQAQCDWITSQVGAERLIRLASNPALTGFSAPKLLWVRDNEPQLYERVRRFLLPKDYIRFRLTGEFATEVSDASGTLLFDVAQRRWSAELLHLLNVDSSLLPRCVESPDVTGTVTPAAACLTGLQAGTPVVGGAGDQAASAVGNGIVEPGLTSVTLGTSGVVFAYTETPKLDPRGRIHTFCHAVPGRWHVMGVTQGAGLSLRWFRDQLGTEECRQATETGSDPYDLLVDQAREAPPGCDGLIFLPYLMGERTPHLDPQARGVWFGLTAAHTRAHLIRSILEGVAFSLRDSLEIFGERGIPVEQIRLSGGGARNALWRQIQADVYGRELVTLAESEGSALGAALLAGVGGGVYSSVQEAARWLHLRQRIDPQPESARLYARQYEVYRALYPAVKDLAHQLAGISGPFART
jgi:xylulokinase